MSTLRAAGVTAVLGEGRTARRVLDDVSLQVDAGELLALVGPSGSGKTTVLSILGGLQAPTDGSVVVDGVSVPSLSGRALVRFRAETVGFVFQQHELVPYLTAQENVELVATFRERRLSSRQRRERARALLVDLDLGDLADRLPEALSVGEQQRVAIARALCNEPTVLLADEPTASLGTADAQRVVELLLAQVRERHVAGVLATHDERMAARADRVVTLTDGQVAAANHPGAGPLA